MQQSSLLLLFSGTKIGPPVTGEIMITEASETMVTEMDETMVTEGV